MNVTLQGDDFSEEEAFQIAMEALSNVAIEEIVLTQIKRQIDDSQANGKPMLPLWVDRVGFKIGPRGGASIIHDQYKKPSKKALAKHYRRWKKKVARALVQLRAVRGKMKKVARLVARVFESDATRYARLFRASKSKFRAKQARDSFAGPRAKKTVRRPRPGDVYYSYRRGGKPLLDTRQGYAAVSTTAEGKLPELTVRVRAPAYMVYQHAGFTTKGPNFMPVSLLAKRIHQKGRNPRAEGLFKGKDFWIFRNGVTIPPRPFAKLGPKYMQRVAKTIARSMRANSNG